MVWLLFLGFLFIGVGVGRLVGEPGTLALIGAGAGLVAVGVARAVRDRPRARETRRE